MIMMLFALTLSLGANAYIKTVAVDGVYYNVEVTEGYASVNIQNQLSTATSISIKNTVSYDNMSYPVTHIDNEAFKDNAYLRSITLPANMRNIGRYAFSGCSNLSRVTSGISGSVGSQSSSIGSPTVVYDIIGEHAFEKTALTGMLAIYTDSIGPYCFSECDKLETVGLTASSIPTYCFSYCSKLNSIIMRGCRAIGHSAFLNSSLLTTVTLQSAVPTSIGNYAFANTMLSSYTVSSTVKQIGVGAFNTLTNTVVTYNNSRDAVNSMFNGKQTLRLGSSITKIPSLKNQNFAKVIVPKNITSSVANCFSGCSKEIEFEADVAASLIRTVMAGTQFSVVTMDAESGLEGTLLDNMYVTTLNLPNYTTFNGQIFRNCPNISTITANPTYFEVHSNDDAYFPGGVYSRESGMTLCMVQPKYGHIKLRNCRYIWYDAVDSQYIHYVDARNFVDEAPQLTQVGALSTMAPITLVRAGNASPFKYFRQAGSEIIEVGETAGSGSGTSDKKHTLADVTALVDELLHAKNIEYVDLGLESGMLWCSVDLGSESETVGGDQYTWGDPEPAVPVDMIFPETNYKWYTNSLNEYSKYNSFDGKYLMDDEDDAAYVADGANIPTVEQWTELLRCSYKKEVINGVTCYRFSNNGNSIVIPNGGYWTYELDRSNRKMALGYFLDYSVKRVLKQSVVRYTGMRIRPVKMK